MIFGYIRVSTDKQTVENQRFEINEFCRKQNLVVDGWIEETISGTKSYDKRKLGQLLNQIQKGDLIICAELSRLGRNLFMIMEILNICMQKECRVWTVKDNYRLGDDIQSKVLAFAFGLSAEIERNLISQRTKEALARRKAEGVHLGRIKGSHNSYTKLTGYEDIILELIAFGIPKAVIARKLNVNVATIFRFLRAKKWTDECNGFDIVIGNPPYIKEYENKNAFDGFRDISPYYMGKMDLWYGFVCHGLDLLCYKGHLCFIAQNNWTTSAGAKLLRKKVIETAKIKQLLDFNTYMVFENASIQTMIMLFQNNTDNDSYNFDYRMLLGNAEKNHLIQLLNKSVSDKTEYLLPLVSKIR